MGAWQLVAGVAGSVAVVAALAGLYWASFELNRLLFEQLNFSSGVHWVFLPSGVRLLLVLVWGAKGALAIAAASALTAWLYRADADALAIVVPGLISGLAPWLAWQLGQRHLGLREDLSNLRGPALLGLALLFAVLSSSLHQLWYGLRGDTEDLLPSLAVMIVGDLTGSLVVLYILKFAITLLRKL